MKYIIPQDILDVTECNSEYSCLSKGKCKNCDQCSADFTGSKYITFLKASVSKEVLQECPYVFAAYDKLVCKCPVRYYLFNEYRI